MIGLLQRLTRQAAISLKRGVQLTLASIVGLGSGFAEEPLVSHSSIYLYPRILTSENQDTRDLYAGQTYTVEVRAAIPSPLYEVDAVTGMSFSLFVPSSVVPQTLVQENPMYSKDVFAGRKFIPGKNVVRVNGASIRAIDTSKGAVGVREGDHVVARVQYTIREPATYTIIPFKITDAKVWARDGKERTHSARDLSAVAVNKNYGESVIAMYQIRNNDHNYPDSPGVEFYFSVRDKRVFLEKSTDLQTWDVLYSNLETCPSFTLKVLNPNSDSIYFFRIRPGTFAP